MIFLHTEKEPVHDYVRQALFVKFYCRGRHVGDPLGIYMTPMTPDWEITYIQERACHMQAPTSHESLSTSH